MTVNSGKPTLCGKHIQNNSRLFGILACAAAGVTFAWELSGDVSPAVVLFLPLVAVLIFWNIFALIKTNVDHGQKFRCWKSELSLAVLCFCVAVTCTPAILFSSIRNHPFNDLHWLSVSAAGLLFALSLINYCLKRPMVSRSPGFAALKKVWSLRPALFMAAAFLWVFVVALFLSVRVFDSIPHVQDAIAQLFQAKIFASGRLTAAPPPLPEFFEYFFDNIIITDRWYSQYPPGHPFFLMLGLFAGVPGLVNPLFAALSAVLLYQTAMSYFGEKEARLATLLFCFSPFVLFMSSSFMNHVSALFFLLVTLYALRQSLIRRSPAIALVAGLALGIIINIRPGDGFALAFPIGLYILIGGWKKRQYTMLPAFIFGVFCMIVVLLGYNYLTNGDPFLFGYQVHWGKDHTIGFSGTSVMERPVHTHIRGCLYTLRNAIVLNQNLFEWPFPSLLPLYLMAMPFLFRKTYNDYFFFGALLAVPIFYYFYFFQDLCLGARFYYSCVPFVLILSARSIVCLTEQIGPPKIRFRMVRALVFLFCVGLVFAAGLRFPKLYRYYADSFWGINNDIMETAREMGLRNALVFQKSYDEYGNDLGAGLQNNTPDLDGPVIFARDLGKKNRELMHLFPSRKYYLALNDKEGKVVIKQIFLNHNPF